MGETLLCFAKYYLLVVIIVNVEIHTLDKLYQIFVYKHRVIDIAQYSLITLILRLNQDKQNLLLQILQLQRCSIRYILRQK